MATSNVKLPRAAAFALVGVEELWLCDTHLLCIRNVFGTELYQRFYYRDIETISVETTPAQAWVTVALLVTVGLFMYLMVLVEVSLFVGRILLFPFLILFFLNLDTSCRTELKTRVNTRHLASLSRVKVTRRALALLSERICAAQADEQSSDGFQPLNVVETDNYPSVPHGVPAVQEASQDATRYQEESAREDAHPAQTGMSAPLSDAIPPPLPKSACPGWRWHYAVFALLVFQITMGIMSAVAPSFATAVFSALLVFACALCCVIAQIAHRRQAAAASMRTVCWAVLIFEMLVAHVLVMAFAVVIRDGSVSSLSAGFSSAVEKTGALIPVLFVCYSCAVAVLAVWFGVQLWRRQTP